MVHRGPEGRWAPHRTQLPGNVPSPLGRREEEKWRRKRDKRRETEHRGRLRPRAKEERGEAGQGAEEER